MMKLSFVGTAYKAGGNGSLPTFSTARPNGVIYADATKTMARIRI